MVFTINPRILINYGFTAAEIDAMLYVHSRSRSGNVTAQSVQTLIGADAAAASRIKYAYDLCSGKVSIATDDDLCRHLKKMTGGGKITLASLPLSRIDKINRSAFVGNIRDSVYQSLNSKNYPAEKRLYPVLRAAGGRVHIFADKSKKPVLPHGHPKKIDGVLEIIDVSQLGAEIAVNDKYCKICNSYVVVASLRHPQAHLGARGIIAFDGTKVYVYAANIGVRDKVGHLGGTNRVYSYGVYPNETAAKLQAETNALYKVLGGVKCLEIPANSEFSILSAESDANGSQGGVSVEL
jgi:hypothetical protein